MNALQKYFELARSQLDEVMASQLPAMEKAAGWVGETMVSQRWVYAFGTGHSHMLAEEIFYRAGGLARASPILDSQLMLHERAIEATYIERREGLAASLLDLYPVEAGDLLIVASNSGRNAVPVEMALEGRRRGLRVVALTNLRHSNAWPSRHSSGRRLADAADITIDNCGVVGDACLALEGLPGLIGPTSTITGAFIVNAIIVQGIQEALRRGSTPEIFISSNSDGDDHNHLLLDRYKSRVRHL